MRKAAGELMGGFLGGQTRSGFFAFAGAASAEAGVEIQSEIETYMIDGGNHKVKLQVKNDNKSFVLSWLFAYTSKIDFVFLRLVVAQNRSIVKKLWFPVSGGNNLWIIHVFFQIQTLR